MADHVTVLFFAALREQVGLDSLSVAIPPHGLSVTALRHQIEGETPSIAAAFAEQPRLRVAINKTLGTFEQVVHPGDEVAFFPPMTGG
ncbi:molybdopterin converting factor subunit 1 [Acetobacter syzygii]|uniref:Molybdopterin synthase sulfur carrier subunit n=1 Tax=Acetobacter syzygii TaxID=146476 RepID=A0A270BTL9_9PROT|nr:molybdopterin converting factor subunit 1 [Acetobacter syzygii]PAL28319.1 molybdopterin synthase sulfur carrier subunit [Acetobacter syzygii]PAL28747.1 molybdopterin synthase sulfur carrier subunit [Acetobacter syzygii]GAN71255.1 molybdopterin converting factor small subunit MoeD [Acetobacter syzygii]GBR63481.1 molybdopterin converting factor small subunit MoeD [Acetobacter syzygii NRIC 0483]GEL55137.1 molybdopterin synthase sulfur carrier subunit [Acetobacter syzygii]